MKHSTLTTATLLALGTALISGGSTFVAKIGVTAVKNPLVFTTLKNAVVAIMLVGLVIGLRRWRELRTLSRSQWGKLLAIGLIGGSVPFALFFIGLSQTTALNAALIHKTLFLWVLLLAMPILKERLSRWQWLGILSVAAANFFVGGFTGFKLNTGELMILGATLLWAVENIIAKVALRDVSALTVAGARMVFGSLVLVAVVAVRGGGTVVTNLSANQWGWTLLASVLLLGYVLTWYAALKRAPATYVATLLVPATLITNLLSAIFITHALPMVQLLNAAGVAVGVTLLIAFPRRVVTAESSQASSSVS